MVPYAEGMGTIAMASPTTLESCRFKEMIGVKGERSEAVLWTAPLGKRVVIEMVYDNRDLRSKNDGGNVRS